MDAISCLAPPPAALMATSYTDAVIARALHFSSTTMSPDSSTSASSSSSSLSHHHSPLLTAALADLPSAYYAPPPVPPHAVACDSVLVVADSPRRRSSPTAKAPGRQTHHQSLLAPAGARAGKRRSRASKRAPTTYISTDAANFRLMVQQITGAQPDLPGGDVDVMTMLQVQQATALLGAAGDGNAQLVPAAGDEAAALRQQHQLQVELQQQPCFPTLDSWNVMYGTDSAQML